MLRAVGVIEKDEHGDVLWTWMYPTLSTEMRQHAMQNCCLTWDNATPIVPVVYTRCCRQWLYLRTETTDRLPKVTHVCVVLISVDFNPHLYPCLAQLMLSRYLNSASTVGMLEAFLDVTIRGRCQSVDNGTINVCDFNIQQHARSQCQVKEIMAMFGIEFIIVFTALLLKKCIVVYDANVTQLLAICSSLPALVWHRLNWSILYPLVHMTSDSLKQLEMAGSSFVAGFMDSAITLRPDFYDVLLNVPSKEISISPHAKESFTMGKLHRELATFLTQCVSDETKSNSTCVQEIAGKTGELLNNLKSLGSVGDDGTVQISAETLQRKRMPPATQNFLLNFAAAEGLLQL